MRYSVRSADVSVWRRLDASPTFPNPKNNQAISSATIWPVKTTWGRSDYALELATGQRVELLFGPTRIKAMQVDCMKQRGWATHVTHAFVDEKTNTIQGSWGEP